jgi:two-component system cell cycle sensor histidine kinase/response regulator CckA
VTASSGVIVVVDDEEMVRGVIAAMLVADGFEVLEAENGEHALEVMTEHRAPVDLLISDINMPQMDGLELVSFLRAAYPSLKALFVSGQGTEWLMENRDRMTDGTHFMAKPFQPDALRQRVREIIAAGPPTG